MPMSLLTLNWQNKLVKAVGYIDGEISDLADTRVPVIDRGFLYGDSVYEVFRTYSGIPFLFDEHYQRLLNSACLIAMDINQSKSDIIAAIKQSVAASQPAIGEDVYVRYQITRGEGAIDLDPTLSLQTRLVIIVKAVPTWNKALYDKGVVLAIPKLCRNSVNSLNPNIKGGNYLNNIIALGEAKKRGANDCLMLDATGQVSECSNSNVWFVVDGQLITPATGNLDGLTKRTLIGLFANANIEVVQRSIHSDELSEASECFITSATREIMPVRTLYAVDGNQIDFPAGGGNYTQQAMRIYNQMLDDFVKQHKESAWF